MKKKLIPAKTGKKNIGIIAAISIISLIIIIVMAIMPGEKIDFSKNSEAKIDFEQNSGEKFVPKYENQIDMVLYNYKEASSQKVESEISTYEKIKLQGALEDVVNYLEDKLNFKVSENKKKIPETYYSYLETDKVSMRFDADTCRIYINILCKEYSEEKIYFTQVHELIHYLSYDFDKKEVGFIHVNSNGGTTGLGITEGITQQLSYLVCENKYPGITKRIFNDKNLVDTYQSIKEIASMLAVKNTDIYKLMLSADYDTFNKKFDKGINKKTDAYEKANPSQYLFCGIDSINDSSVIEDYEKLKKNLIGVFELVVMSCDTNEEIQKVKELLPSEISNNLQNIIFDFENYLKEKQ